MLSFLRKKLKFRDFFKNFSGFLSKSLWIMENSKILRDCREKNLEIYWQKSSDSLVTNSKVMRSEGDFEFSTEKTETLGVSEKI